MAETNTQKLSRELRQKLNDRLAGYRAEAHQYDANIERGNGLTKTGNLSAEYVRERLAEHDLSGKLSALRDEAKANAAAMREAHAEAYKRASTISSSDDINQSLLEETRSQKIWQRLERDLSAKNASPADIVQAALRDGDRLARATILSEFPSWAKAHGTAVNLDSYANAFVPELEAAAKEIANADNYALIVESNIRKIETAANNNLTAPPGSVDDLGHPVGNGETRGGYLDPDKTIFG